MVNPVRRVVIDARLSVTRQIDARQIVTRQIDARLIDARQAHYVPSSPKIHRG